MASKGRVMSDAEKLYQMLQPGPKFLISRPRQLIRHGELMYFSVNTLSKKPRYFWLFNDCLLITKRVSAQKFQLQVVIHFSPGMKVVTMPDSPVHEFRLLCPEKGTLAKAKQRRVVMWGKNREHKELWLTDLKNCLWKSTGMVGPDPSSPQAAGGAYSTKNDDEEMRHMMKEVSLRDRRPSDPQRQYDQARGTQPGGGGGRGAGVSPARQQQPPQQHQADYGEEEYEQYSDEGEPDGDEHWSEAGTKSDALISFDDDFPQTSTEGQHNNPYLQQRPGYSSQVPPGVGLAPIGGYSQQQGAGQYAAQGYYASHHQQPQYDAYYGAYAGAPGGGGYAPSQQQQPYASQYGAPPMGGADGAYAGAPGGGGYAPLQQQQPQPPYSGQYGAPPMGGGADGAAYYNQVYGNMQSLYSQMPSYDQTPTPVALPVADLGAGASSAAPTGTTTAGGVAADDFARSELMEATKVVEELALDLAVARNAAEEHIATVAPAFVDMSDSVFDTTQFIARACTVLLSAASRAQLERGYTGSDTAYHADPKWAEGLVSAARFVVASIGHLVSTSKQYVASEGGIGNEPLAASAGSVNVATAQLLSAFRARYQKGNDLGLEEAVKSITSATQKLVEDAKAAIPTGEAVAPAPPAVDPTSKYSLTQRQVVEIEAQARILKLEKEAQAARLELNRLRKAEYSGSQK